MGLLCPVSAKHVRHEHAAYILCILIICLRYRALLLSHANDDERVRKMCPHTHKYMYMCSWSCTHTPSTVPIAHFIHMKSTRMQRGDSHSCAPARYLWPGDMHCCVSRVCYVGGRLHVRMWGGLAGFLARKSMGMSHRLVVKHAYRKQLASIHVLHNCM